MACSKIVDITCNKLSRSWNKYNVPVLDNIRFYCIPCKAKLKRAEAEIQGTRDSQDAAVNSSTDYRGSLHVVVPQV